MPTRDELKALIDQIPEEQLGFTEKMLRRCLIPPKPLPPLLPPGSPGSCMRTAPPELGALSRRGQAYKKEVMRRFEEAGKTAAISETMLSFQFAGSLDDVRYASQSFQHWDEDALVNQEFHYFDGREFDIMARFSTSEDKILRCAIEVSSGGKTVRHSDEFPMRLN